MSQQKRISRRTFVKAAAGAIAAPAFLTGCAATGSNRRRPAPSERITVGFIGMGKMMGDYHLATLLDFPDVQAVAVCDVDTNRREAAKKRVEDKYSGKTDYKGCAAYNDFREITGRRDIDAVVIATPENWHAIPLIEACKTGKDVYCEKPLTLTLAESKACIDAVRKHGCVMQTGSQQRSNVFGDFRQACEFIRSGRIGKISRVTVGVGGPPVPCDLPGEEMEPGLDWDMWLGPAPMRPYHSELSPRGVHTHFPRWRGYKEYAGGGLADFGAHHFDIMQWALDMDKSGPTTIIPPADEKAVHGAKFIYPNGIEVEHGGPGGCTFYGERGTLHIDRGKLESDPAELIKDPIGENEVHLPQSPGHHRDWINCIRSRQRCIADVEVGARSVAICHLFNLVYDKRRKLEWDPAKWRFVDDKEANTWLDRERRDPWKLPKV